MSDSTLTIRVDSELKEAFVQYAKSRDRTSAQLLRDFMRQSLQQTSRNEDYEAWFRAKVEKAMLNVAAGNVLSQEEVEARVAERRKQLRTQYEMDA